MMNAEDLFTLNPVLEIFSVDEATLNVIAPTGRFSIKDESLLVQDIVRAANAGLSISAFISENSGKHSSEKILEIFDALQQRGIITIAAKKEAQIDPFFTLLEQLPRQRLDDAAASTIEPHEWTLHITGRGEVAASLLANLADLQIKVEHGVDGLAPIANAGKRLIVACSDREDFPEFRAINRLAIETATPALYVYLDQHLLRTGPFVVPGATACIECFFHRIGSNRQFPSEFNARSSPKNILATAQGSRVAARCSALAVPQILAYMAGSAMGAHVGLVREYDLLRGSMRSTQLLRLPRCPVCGTASKRPAAQVYQPHPVSRRGA